MMKRQFSKLFHFSLLAFFLIPVALIAGPELQGASRPETLWDRDLAMQAAARGDTDAEADRLLLLAKNAAGPATLRALQEISSRSDWNGPAREATLLRFTEKLRDLPPFSVEAEVMIFLLDYQNQVLVAQEESHSNAVPLFPIRAVARGLLHQWTRQQAEMDAVDLLAFDLQQLVSTYADSKDPNIRAGIESVVGTASQGSLQDLLDYGVPLLPGNPALTGLLGASAVQAGDLQAMSQVLIHGTGPELVEISRQVSQRFSAAALEKLLQATIGQTPASTTAIMKTELIQKERERTRGGKPSHQLQAASGFSLNAGEPAIEQWTAADGVLGLGYPVPIPVDTPLPFDGFRSYNGLHTRHQDLMATTSIVHGEVVGTTHNGREIWAYRIGDADLLSRDGRAEPATLTNGGIHAREWQTPEVVTGIMELFAEKQGDHHFYDFLLENVNMVLLPVQNVDGYLQTQRYPSQNWLYSDPFDLVNDPQPSPRDGRMRRKNMPGVDEILSTSADHLLGVDLNRNNPPLWNTNLNRSSPDNRSLVYHGAAPHSEPESQALLAAGALGPTAQLRAYTDVHSFSQNFYFHRTSNRRLSSNTVNLLFTMSRHNAALPNGKTYTFSADINANVNQGFGMTNEWFTTSLEIPSWGVEVEPSSGQAGLPGNPPGCGADYGGLARNCHDGFILPESQIRRVREELARSFAAVYYQQAGPPSVAAVRFVDAATQAVVFEAEWDPVGEDQRQLYVNQVQPLALGREYIFWIAYDRPMRWRRDNQVVAFPGQPSSTLDFFAGGFAGGSQLTTTQDNAHWVNNPGDAPNGYYRYRDDSVSAKFSFPADQTNLGLVTSDLTVTLHNRTTNMTGQALDSDPATAITWAAGGWSGYEDDNGGSNDLGGTDKQIKLLVSPDAQEDPFLIGPGISAAWSDPSHDGEGFVIEILAGNRAVMYWFTYDSLGEQVWYVAAGEVRGNRLLFPELIQTSGGTFGPDFDPATVVRTVKGSATFLFESCEAGTMVYELPGQKGRFNLQRMTRVMGANCGGFLGPPIIAEATDSGSWASPEQDGHGFVIEVLFSSDVVVYWFTYDQAGNQAWLLGVGEVEDGDLVISEVYQTRGPVFGPEFNPDDLELIPWGEMRFDLSCTTGSMRYDGTLAGFGSGTIPLKRVTSLDGLACVE